MTEWLLLITLMSGGKLDQIAVSRLPSQELCEQHGVKDTKAKRKGSAAFVCFEVARLPKQNRLNPVVQPKR